MPEPLRGLSSMATKDLLARLVEAHDLDLAFESAGGVAVAERVRRGEAADLVVLASAALAGLDADGLLVVGTLRRLFVSDVVAAVPASRADVAWGTEDDLRALLEDAGRIAFSTGPSGTELTALLERWGLLPRLEKRLLQAPPGVPVGSILAAGDADLGFQQHSELADVDGVRVLGSLPGDAAIRSRFAGAVLSTSAQPDRAAEVLAHLGAVEHRAIVEAAWMSLAD